VEKPASINRLHVLSSNLGGDKARGVKGPWSNATPLGQSPSPRSYSLRGEGQTFSVQERSIFSTRVIIGGDWKTFRAQAGSRAGVSASSQVPTESLPSPIRWERAGLDKVEVRVRAEMHHGLDLPP